MKAQPSVVGRSIIIRIGCYSPPSRVTGVIVENDNYAHHDDEHLAQLDDGRILPIKKNGRVPNWRGSWWFS